MTVITCHTMFLSITFQIVYDEPELVRRPAARGLEYRDSAYESRRHSQFTGMSLENFRLLSVLGRGHFGKVGVKLWFMQFSLIYL